MDQHIIDRREPGKRRAALLVLEFVLIALIVNSVAAYFSEGFTVLDSLLLTAIAGVFTVLHIHLFKFPHRR